MNKNFTGQILERCGLPEHPKGSICGVYKGYNVIIREIPKKFFSVSISARPDGTFDQEAFNSFIDSLKRINGVLTCNYSANVLVIMVQPNIKLGSAETVQKCMDEAAAFFQKNNFISFCGKCGDNLSVKPYCLCGINGGLEYLCNDCYGQILQEGTQPQSNKEKKGSMAAGILGALLGALLGCVVWIIVYNLGFIAGLAGLAIAVCALKGYEKFGGTMNTAGIIVSILIIIFMVYFAQTMSYAIQVYPTWSKEYGLNFFDIYSGINRLIFSDPEITPGVIQDLVIGYALTAIASFSTVRNIIINSKNGNGHNIVRY